MLKFKVNSEFEAGINNLSKILDYNTTKDITVTAEKGDRIGVSLDGSSAVIYYRDKVQFFRGIGVLLENIKVSDKFEIFDDGFFETITTMIDTSRCAVPTVKTLKTIVDYLAVMGYGGILLYIEDVIELEGYPYFGYMRGRYTVSQLKEVDDYAYEYGIEVIPCIECYGHMEKYLIWPAAWCIKDTDSVLLAREPQTFKLLEKLISTISSAFRSKRIHIGMDESVDMGRGQFLSRHGYVPPFDIFNEVMDSIIAITDKYGLKAMMWSDMYFRISSGNQLTYYSDDIVIPDDVKEKIPEGIELVYWHYGEQLGCDDYMMKKHNDLGRRVIFAGGSWSWCGHFPEYNFMKLSNSAAIKACRNNNVHEAMMTVWRDDNAECDFFADLYTLSYFAELCYNPDLTEETFKSRFHACTGADADLFLKMSYYHNDFERKPDYSEYWTRFLGKPLFWQDIMEGIYDLHLHSKKMSDHYEDAARIFEGSVTDERWGYLFNYAYCAMDYMSTKAFIAENLIPAYQSGNKELLGKIANEYLPLLKAKTDAVHSAHKTAWFRNSKIIGWQNLDIRYGGVKARCDTASMLINAYLNGEIPTLEELDETRLHHGLSGFVHYSGIATVNKKI